jgi:quercetin dioxygenase-like cupin family protein
MLHAFKLYIGADRASHVVEGTIAEHITTQVASIRFQESPPHSSFDWHDAAHIQYVITIAGTLEFMTRDGEIFVLRPGDVLLAKDNVGSGHKWRLIDDDPWRRVYVVLQEGASDLFTPKSREASIESA